MATEQLELGYDNTASGGTLVLLQGTYTGSRMGNDDRGNRGGSNGLRKALTVECTEGHVCLFDGEEDHRCLTIMFVDEPEFVTLKRITVANGKTVDPTPVSYLYLSDNIYLLD